MCTALHLLEAIISLYCFALFLGSPYHYESLTTITALSDLLDFSLLNFFCSLTGLCSTDF